MNTSGSWLSWLFRAKCFFCEKRKAKRIGAHVVHIKHGEKIDKVKICDHCIVDLYRGNGVVHGGQKPF